MVLKLLVSLLNAEEFCGGLERHPVNSLLRQLHGVKADAAEMVALFLHRDVKPILLLHRVPLALVVTGCVSLLGLLLRGVVKALAHNNSARCAGGAGERVTVGKFVAEICPARAERHVADGARCGATGEQASDESKEKCNEPSHVPLISASVPGFQDASLDPSSSLRSE